MKDKIVIKSRDGTELAVSRFLPQVSNYTVVIIAPALVTGGEVLFQAGFFCKRLCRFSPLIIIGSGRSKSGAHRKMSTLYQWASIDLDTVIPVWPKSVFGMSWSDYHGGIRGGGGAPAIPFFSRLVLADAALSSWALANRRGGYAC